MHGSSGLLKTNMKQLEVWGSGGLLGSDKDVQELCRQTLYVIEKSQSKC